MPTQYIIPRHEILSNLPPALPLEILPLWTARGFALIQISTIECY